MKKKVKTLPDKNGNMLDFYQSDSIAFTPALSLFLKVYAEIIDKGFGLPRIDFNNDTRVVWAQYLDGKVAAGIAYEYQADKRCGWVVLSFTNPDDRGKGIHKMLHPLYEEDSRSLGATHLSSYVNVNNTVRLATLKSVGFQPIVYKTFKSLT